MKETIWKGNNKGKRLHGEGHYMWTVLYRKETTKMRLYREKITWGEYIYGKEIYTERRLHWEETTLGDDSGRGLEKG